MMSFEFDPIVDRYVSHNIFVLHANNNGYKIYHMCKLTCDLYSYLRAGVPDFETTTWIMPCLVTQCVLTLSCTDNYVYYLRSAQVINF